MNKQNELIINDDCLVAMKKMPTDSVDLVCSDPPYGYSFMGKDWDTFNEVVDPQGSFGNEKGFKKLPRNKPNGMYAFMLPIWKEALRLLKPGAFAFVMCAPRQDVLAEQIRALTDAGFDMSYSSIYWTYASGFPKAHNIGKAVDKMKGVEREIVGYGMSQPQKCGHMGGLEGEYKEGQERYSPPLTPIPVTPEAKALEGSYGGFQPKPAVEVIIVAMKPMTEKTFASQALNNGKGITWLDDCRIPYGEETPTGFGGKKNTECHFLYGENGFASEPNKQGRFPANLLVSDNVLDNGVISKGSIGYNGLSAYGSEKCYGGKGNPIGMQEQASDKGSYSRYFDLDKWAEVNNIKPETTYTLDNNTPESIIAEILKYI